MATERQAAGRPRAARSERFEARLTESQKELLTYAANLEGESVTNFVVRAAMRTAKRVLSEPESTKLSQRDRAALVDALRNPPEPNKQLKAALNRYRRDYVR